MNLARRPLFDGAYRVAAFEHRGRALHQPVPIGDIPAERVGQAHDHVEQRGDMRGIVERIARDAGGVGSFGVRGAQLVRMKRLLLDERKRGTKPLVDRGGAPVLPDRIPDFLAERIRRDRAVGGESKEALVQV